MSKSVQVAATIPNSGFAQDAEWLASDYEATDVGKLRFNIAVDSAVIVEYTLNSGTDWVTINEGDALVADASYGFSIYIRAGDLVNFKSPSAGTTTVIIGRLDLITDEG